MRTRRRRRSFYDTLWDEIAAMRPWDVLRWSLPEGMTGRQMQKYIMRHCDLENIPIRTLTHNSLVVIIRLPDDQLPS